MANRYVLGACPVCGAAASTTITDRDGSLAELESLWEYAAGDGARIVPLSRLRDTLAFTQPPPFALVQCRGCGLLFRNPRERDVRELYETEHAEEHRLRELHAAQLPEFSRLVRQLTELNGGVGKGLEVGSYAGAFLTAAAAAGWNFLGSDVNPGTVAFLRSCGHDVCSGGIEDCLVDGALDVVACWNTFEQLPDPRAAAVEAAKRMRPGGLLALRVPSGRYYRVLRPHLDGVAAGLARTLLARHNLLGFPYRHGFTLESLDTLLASTGFVRVRAQAAAVLPAGPGRGGRAIALLERALRPLTGPPWLEVYARRR